MSSKLLQAIRRVNRKSIYGSIGVLAIFSSGGAVQAQTQTQTAAELEEIVVQGIRGSLRQSLFTKRYSNAVVDAITSEDIGKFPDKNVAESLSRIPGVTISRDYGEGQGVTIRGLEPGLNLTLVNGQAVGTSQWFVLSEAERNFNFEMLSSEMLSAVQVYKSSQADIDEGGLGGTVNLVTRKPLSLDANTFQASIDGQYSDLPEKWDPSVSALYSWKNDDESFGVLLALSHQERTVRREGTELFTPAYFGPTDRDQGFQDALMAPQGASESGYVPWGVGSALFNQDRERNGVDVNLQWAPNENFSANLHYFYSEMKADNRNQNFIAIPFRGLFGPNNVSSGTVENSVVTSLQVDGGDPAGWANHVAYDSIFRDGSSMDTEVFDLDGTYDGGGWRLHAQVGTTTGEGTNNDEFYEFFAHSQDPRVNFDFTNPGGSGPAIDYARSPWVQNPTDEMLLTGVFDQTNSLEDTEDYLQLDLALDVEFGVVNEIKLGAKLRDRSFGQDRFKDEMANAVVGDPNLSLGTAGQFANGTYTVDHDETSQGATTVFQVNQAAMRQAFQDLPTCGSAGLDPAAVCARRGLFDSAASYSIDEQITALYAMANFEGESVRGNVGLRYVTTETDSNAYDLAAPTLTPISSSGEYSEFLPSLNLVWDLNEDLLLRFAAGKALSRPAPFQLTSAVNLTPETSSGTSGNPNLEPLIANQYEVGLEWYFKEASVLSVAVFKKDIENFIFTTTTAATINGTLINRLTRPENGPSATLDGIEVNFQYAFDNGFGVAANYSYTDVGEAKLQRPVLVDGAATLEEESAPFPFSSKDSYNISGYYENEMFSARLNYSYRSEFFKGLQESGQLWGDEQGTLDGQISYHLNDNITIRFEALNLTGETIDDIYKSARGHDLTATQFYNGRRFIIGASFKY